MKKGPRSLLDIMTQPGTALDELVRRAEKVDRLGRAVATLIGEPIGAHVVSANLRDDALTVITDSPVWAARLRFESERLLNGLRESAIADVHSLTVKVRAPGVE
ncbi:MAG TPA: DUF721 domain-containing protein [Gammaproteobacteria bacterium]|nr:DUF721 domain-containing protein [Gammaproteobacteria bacterium]